MAYVQGNPKTKSLLKKAVKAGQQLSVFSPGPFPVEQNGRVSVEGPHFPEPHKWYATVQVKDGIIEKVIG